MDNSFGRRFINAIFNNRQIVALLFGFVVIAGSVSFYFFKPQGFPTFNINIAIVTAKYPGATALQVEEKLVKPIERAVGEVKSVEEYTSTANDSFGIVMVTFKDSVKLVDAMRDLEGKLANVTVPEGADKPEASAIDANGPTSIVAVTIDTVDGVVNDWELYRKANSVKDKIETVAGVKEVKIMNPLTPTIEIVFDEAKLAKLGLQRSMVEGVLKAAQFEMPVGSFVDVQNDKYTLGVTKSLADVQALSELTILPNLKLKDVATVTVRLNNDNRYNRVGHREYETDTIADAGAGKIDQAIVLSIMSQDGEDVIGLGKRLDDAYEDLTDKSELGSNVKITKVYDSAKSTADQLKEIKESIIGGPIDALGPFAVVGYLFGGITLVVLFLLIFVNWRVALLAGLSIPLAIGMTAAYLKLTGVSINTIVLFSMILVVGLVVDPTIVFLEAMQRYREQGYSGRDAAVKTFNSVGIGVLLSAVANFVVFVPFGVVSGFFGQIIQYIPKTVIPSIVASFIVPTLFFLPLASHWLRARGVVNRVENQELVGVWKISRSIGQMITNLLGLGGGKKVLRFLILLIAVIAPVAVAGAYLASNQVRIVQFAQPDDSINMMVSGTVSSRWDFSKAVTVIDPVQRYLMAQPEVRKFAVYQQDGNSFVLFIELFPILERSKENLRTATQLVEDANKYFATISNAQIEASVEGGGPPSESFPVSIRLFDNDLDKLQVAATDVGDFLKGQDGVTRVENSLNMDGKLGGVQLVLDGDNPVNLNPFTVVSAIRDKLSETNVTTMDFGGETFEVVTKMDKSIRTVDDVKNLPVAVSSGMPTARRVVAIPTVNDFITGTQDQKSQSIERLNGKRYVTIRAKVDKDTDPLKVQAELTKYLDKDKLKQLGLSESTATETKGVTGSVAKSFSELLIALLLALFLIYVILVGFFKSFLSPLIILFAVPLGFIGVFPAVSIATGQLGFLELLGVVAMAGIVVNVTILIIDFANQMRAHGMSAQEAIATSIAVRFKPILLTKMTIFAGLMPLALFSPFWRGLAAVIVFGIIVSGFLSFITTPILYVWFDAMGKWFKPRPKAPAIVFPVNPMQAAPIEPMMSPIPANNPMAAKVSTSPSAGLWGELPTQAPIRQSDQWAGDQLDQ